MDQIASSLLQLSTLPFLSMPLPSPCMRDQSELCRLQGKRLFSYTRILLAFWHVLSWQIKKVSLEARAQQ